jgi:8-oxo-dGTP pyrophosphatase MutT (NUDIX family)
VSKTGNLSTATPELRAAATVVLLRDGDHGVETLMLKRNKALLFAGGVWVFPGGALDPSDLEAGDGTQESAARIAAAREAQEESGLEVDADTMVQISHWTTPVVEPKRFYTWFFLALAPPEPEVVIDGSEIHDHRWMNIDDAIAAHEAGELGLFPPTIMTLRALQGYMSAEDAMIGVAARDPYEVFPVFASGGEDIQVFYRGDVSYDSADPTLEGPRHRCILRDKVWQYIHEGVEPGVARLDS